MCTPPGSKFLHFHGVFGKNWLNNRLASPFGVGVPSSEKSWIHHWVGHGFKPHWGKFLMKFILYYVTSDLSDNLTEMRQISLWWKTWIKLDTFGYISLCYFGFNVWPFEIALTWLNVPNFECCGNFFFFFFLFWQRRENLTGKTIPLKSFLDCIIFILCLKARFLLSKK